MSIERVKVKSFKMEFLMRTTQAGTGALYGFHRRMVMMLAAGRQIDILEWLDTNQANPIGSLAQVTEYMELTKSVRILAAKRVNFYHQPNHTPSTGTEEALMGMHYRKSVRSLRISIRKPFWLREPEQVTLVCFSYVTGLLAGSVTDVTSVTGNHQAQVTTYRY